MKFCPGLCRLSPAILLCIAMRFTWADAVTEEELKAALTYKFAQFTDWPASPGEFVFCSCGQDSSAMLLSSLSRRKLKDINIVVKVPTNPEEAKICNVLFLNHTKPSQRSQWLEVLRGLPILTISDGPNTWDKGVMIYLTSESNRIRFDINLAAARNAGLNLRSQMLRLAREIRD